MLAKKTMTDRDSEQGVLGWLVDTDESNISLPSKKVQDGEIHLEEWPRTRQTSTVKEVFVLAWKLHHMLFVITPGQYFMCRLVQLVGRHPSRTERAEGGGICGKRRKTAHAGNVPRLWKYFIANVAWWRWHVGERAGR